MRINKRKYKYDLWVEISKELDEQFWWDNDNEPMTLEEQYDYYCHVWSWYEDAMDIFYERFVLSNCFI